MNISTFTIISISNLLIIQIWTLHDIVWYYSHPEIIKKFYANFGVLEVEQITMLSLCEYNVFIHTSRNNTLLTEARLALHVSKVAYNWLKVDWCDEAYGWW